MNYFEFYNIPISFYPDENLIRQRFYAYSKEYHPDFYANESAEKQAEILELSTLNNRAYQTLNNPEKRLKHILELNGMLEDGDKYTLSQGFLMEMMDINESLMDIEIDADEERLSILTNSIAKLFEELEDELLIQTKDFEQLKPEQQITILQKVKDIYYRKKYLLRIKDSLNKFAAR